MSGYSDLLPAPLKGCLSLIPPTVMPRDAKLFTTKPPSPLRSGTDMKRAIQGGNAFDHLTTTIAFCPIVDCHSESPRWTESLDPVSVCGSSISYFSGSISVSSCLSSFSVLSVSSLYVVASLDELLKQQVGFITECVLAFFALVWVIPA